MDWDEMVCCRLWVELDVWVGCCWMGFLFLFLLGEFSELAEWVCALCEGGIRLTFSRIV